MPKSSADPDAFLAVGIQSALGTPQTTAAKFRFVKYLSGSDVEAQIEAVDLREGGDGLDFGYAFKRMQKTVGQIVANVRPEALGQLLAAVPGGATWSGGSAPATHIFHTGHASHPWMTLQIAHPGTSLVNHLYDARFTGITLEGGAGDLVKVTIPFAAINHGASVTVLTPTYYGDDPFAYFIGPSYLIDAAAATGMTAWKIEMGLGVEELQAQEIKLDEMVVQNRDTNVEYTIRYEDATRWKKIYMGAGVTPTTSIATGALDLVMQYDTGATLKLLRLQTRLLSYRGNKLTELDPDGKTVMETVSAKALKGATHTFIAELRNAHASAYGS